MFVGAPRPERPRCATGIEGFDDTCGGGLPLAGVTVVLGGAGAGKTLFGMQVLAASIDRGEPGVLVAFEESAERIVDNIAGFTWGARALPGRGLEVLDARLVQSVELGGEFDLVGLLATVQARALALRARLVVFDGIDVLLGYLGDPALVRREVFRLREWVQTSGFTAIVTAKADAAEARPSADYDFLQFMADCVVTLHHRVSHGVALRTIRVAKYRGSAHSANEHPMTITSGGIEVAASSVREVNHPASRERVSTGIERLDAMLSGGYHRGSSVLITGAPGTAKTSLSAAFTERAAQNGERTLYVSFDESPDQIVRNVASIGIDLRAHITSGVLVVRSLRGRADNPEAHVARIRAFVREVGPAHLVIDPLSALGSHGVASDAEQAALHILELAKSQSITVVSTSLLGNALPMTEQTPLNISTIADTWIHLSYLVQGGERNRALTIVKSRGTGHSNQVRELVLTNDGVTLADVYSAGGEVLLGTLRWERENEERRARQAAQADARLREQRAALALAETNAHLETLARAQAIQQAELDQIRATASADAALQEHESRGLLRRRHADRTAPSRAVGQDDDGGRS